MWVFPKIGKHPKMDGLQFIMENPIDPWMIWGENPLLFLETPIFGNILRVPQLPPPLEYPPTNRASYLPCLAWIPPRSGATWWKSLDFRPWLLVQIRGGLGLGKDLRVAKKGGPWKSKTKQRMVFRMIHVKDSLLPMGKVWSLDSLGGDLWRGMS